MITADRLQTPDLRDVIFAGVSGARVRFLVTARGTGIISGSRNALDWVRESGIEVVWYRPERSAVSPGDLVLEGHAAPKQVALAEENLLGYLSKASGISTAAGRAVEAAGGRMRVVSGAWKKMPPEMKHTVRQAVVDGGAEFRIANPPFVYLDKNYVRILGGIEPTLRAVESLDIPKVIQIRGETAMVADEAVLAARLGATILMVDTGRIEDLRSASEALTTSGLRRSVQLAFAGNIKIDNIPRLRNEDIDVLDIGIEIVDAPLLELRLDVVPSTALQGTRVEKPRR